MTRALKVSTELSLPLSTITATGIIYGAKGAGKTNLAGVIVEEIDKVGLKWSLLDPLGVSWGLRHSLDGKGPGLECVVLGGVHGDHPIDPAGGALVADFIAEEDVNVIIDFSRKHSGEMWSVADRVRFMTDYALRLFQRQGELIAGQRREPICQLLDEAARYIPQTIPAGRPDLARCVGAWEQLVEEGRNVGIGIWLFTQRSARLNKSVAELADVMIAFRTIGPNSLGAVLDWLGEHVEKARIKDLSEQVRKLPVGSALVVSPGWLEFEGIVRFRARETFDSSATPKAGERARKVTGKAAKPDTDRYLARLAEIAERVEADDPRKLHKIIEDLQRKLSLAEREPKKQAEPLLSPVEIPVLHDDDRKLLASIRDKIGELIESSERIVEQHTALRIEVESPLRAIEERSGRRVDATASTRAAAPRPKQLETHAKGPTAFAFGDTSLGIGERAILIAVTQYEGATRDLLSVATGYKRSTRDAYLQRLSTKKLIEWRGYEAWPTDLGIVVLGPDYEPLPTGDALRAHWLAKLPEGEAVILRLLCDRYPFRMTRDEISSGTDYKRSTRDAYIQRLKARKLITVAGEIRASDNLFEQKDAAR